MGTFHSFQPLYNKGEKKIFHSESITHTHTLYMQEYSKKGHLV